MKSYLLITLLLLLIVSCSGNKNDDRQTAEEFVAAAVGIADGSDYKVIDEQYLIDNWGAKLRTKIETGTLSSLSDFSIHKIEPLGGSGDYYMLAGKSTDATVHIGALLVLKENKFYFDPAKISKNNSIRIVVCIGKCEGDSCIPGIVINGDEKHFICSMCSECEKVDVAL